MTYRIFIGTGPRYEAATDTLVYSIRVATDFDPDVHISLMAAGRSPLWSGWAGQPTEATFGQRGRWVTPFSLFRYAVPELCGFQGAALYLDADMLVLSDIRTLFEERYKAGRWAIAENRDGDCVTLMDCSTAQFAMAHLKRGSAGDKHILRRTVAPVTVRTIPKDWNHTDAYDREATKLLHFTNMRTQPWRPYPEAIDYLPHPDSAAVKLWLEWRDAARHYVANGGDLAAPVARRASLG